MTRRPLPLPGSAVVLLAQPDRTASTRRAARSRDRQPPGQRRGRLPANHHLRQRPQGRTRSVQARLDTYSINNPLASDPKNTYSRGLATVGTDISWPFIRQRGAPASSSSRWSNSPPRPTTSATPTTAGRPVIPNEDSVALVFDSHQPVHTQPLSGLRPVRGRPARQRRGPNQLQLGPGPLGHVLVGRSFRDEPNPSFYEGSGLEDPVVGLGDRGHPEPDPGPDLLLVLALGQRHFRSCGARKPASTSTCGAVSARPATSAHGDGTRAASAPSP